MNNCLFGYKSLIIIIFVFCFVFAGCNKREAESPFKSELSDYTSTITSSSGDEISELTGLDEEIEVMSIEIDISGQIAPSPEQIQIALEKAGYYKGKIDGKIGPKSQKAIRDFQIDNDLEPDSKVGPKTWSKLRDYLEL